MLLANASHELRTPLARIRLGIELLKGGPSRTREAELERDIAELDGLIDEVLLLSRLDVIESLDVRETVDLLGLAAEECARYDGCHLDGAPIHVEGDPKLLRRMIRNLLDNAERHGKPPVEVSVAGLDTSGQMPAVLSVTDQGPTLAPEAREDIFQPFRRAGSGSGGAGLGLALVRQIARRHGGEARCEPRPGGGNTFRIELPAVS
jgi:signal transduction histidine kinase